MRNGRPGRRPTGLIGSLSLSPMLILILPIPGALSAADPAFCALLTEAAKATNAQGALEIDATTRQEATVVDCGMQSIETKLTSRLATATLPLGWKDGKQKKLNALYCDDPASKDLIKRGWTFVETTVFADSSTFSIKAVCE